MKTGFCHFEAAIAVDGLRLTSPDSGLEPSFAGNGRRQSTAMDGNAGNGRRQWTAMTSFDDGN